MLTTISAIPKVDTAARTRRPGITVTHSPSGYTWECGKRQRPVTARQAERALEAAGHVAGSRSAETDCDLSQTADGP
jgi:hypothetical protein